MAKRVSSSNQGNDLLLPASEQLEEKLKAGTVESVGSFDIDLFADSTPSVEQIPSEVTPTEETSVGPVSPEDIFSVEVDKIDLETDNEQLQTLVNSDRELYEMDLFDRQETVATEEAEGRDTRRYNIQYVEQELNEDGGLVQRADNFADAIMSRNLDLGAFFHTGKDYAETGMLKPDSQLGVIGQSMVKLKATTSDPELPNPVLNKQFLRIGSLVTEDFLADETLGESRVEQAREKEARKKMFNSSPDVIEQTLLQDDIDIRSSLDNYTITKARGNRTLGDRIAREWGLVNNTDVKLSREESELLGDAFKELYYEVNKGPADAPYIIRRSRSKGYYDEGGNFVVLGKDDEKAQTYFEITKLGQDVFASSRQVRNQYFPKEHIEPLTTPLQDTRPPRSRDQRKRNVRYSGQIRTGEPLTNDDLLDAKANLESVPHVVIPRREKIVYSTMLIGLASKAMEGKVPNEVIAMSKEINGFGESKETEFKARAVIANKKGEYYSPSDNMRELQRTISQSVYGMAKHRNKKVYLTYFIQAFNGRLTPEQTHFNPTTSKTIRFVTGNPKLVKFYPGQNSQLERNLKEMYSMMMVKFNDVVTKERGDAGDLVPSQRIRKFEDALPSLAKAGGILKAALEMTDRDADLIADAIRKGLPMDHPDFPISSVKALNLNPETDLQIISSITAKGEDGLALIDGLIDVHEYYNVLQNNKNNPTNPIQFTTQFNAYIDGKTNGIASNAMQLGLTEMAKRTGVLRSEDSLYALDNNIDIRDELANALTAHIDSDNGGLPLKGVVADSLITEATEVMKRVLTYRPLNKATTMTFGYGKEMMGFKTDIENALELLAVSDPSIKDKLDKLRAGWYKGKKYNQPLEKVLVDASFSTYSDKLIEVITPEGIQARQIMYGTAMLHVMMDELFEFNGPTGFPLRYGGMESTGIEKATEQSYKISQRLNPRPEDPKPTTKIKAISYETRPTSAAVTETKKGPYVGQGALGGSIPGPVQAIDAATVAVSVIGKSWVDMTNATEGVPYVHTIYDAFKFDAHNFNVGVKEVNTNWKNLSFAWSYLEAAQGSLEKATQNFNDKLKDLKPKDMIDISMASPFRQIGLFLNPIETKEGIQVHKHLMSFFRRMHPVGTKSEFIQDEVQQFINDLVARGVVRTYIDTNTKELRYGYTAQIKKEDLLYIVNTIRESYMSSITGVSKPFDNFFKDFIKDTKKRQAKLRRLIDEQEAKGRELVEAGKEDDLMIAQYYAH